MKTTSWAVRALTALALIAFGALAAAADLEEGKDFRRLAKPQPTETGKKVEVIEFFSFSCPHCKDMEPFLTAWLKKLPADVQFRRIPVQFSPAWTGTAKVWYTIEALGREDLSPAVFKAIHEQNVRLDQEKPFVDWAEKQGLERKKVEEMYNSFTVNGKVSRAKGLVQNYGVQSVPTFIVDGRYTTESGTPHQHADVPALLDKLVDKARAEHKS